jgi:hypothetical protein
MIENKVESRNTHIDHLRRVMSECGGADKSDIRRVSLDVSEEQIYHCLYCQGPRHRLSSTVTERALSNVVSGLPNLDPGKLI